jgi:opacity protein-like surface antigen
MRRLIAWAALLVCAALPAAAQDAPRAELFGGYSYARLDAPGPTKNLHGWNAAVQGNLNDWFGLVADFSGHYGERLGQRVSTHQALFGPRLTLRGPVSPFVHALFGVARGNAGLFGSNSSEAAFGMAVGGGLDVKLRDHVNLRLIQGDYLMTRFFDRRQDSFRLSAGLVFRF